MRRILAVIAAAVTLPLPARAAGPDAEAPVEWAATTASPAPLDGALLDPLEQAALARCGRGEFGLREVARAIAARKLRGQAMPEIDAIAFAQRAAGEPHPWARAWAASGRPLAPEATLRALDAWLAEDKSPPLRRCGVAAGSASDGGRVLVVVEVEALADLAPLPIRARTGQWLTVEARLRVPARGGSVVVLGPSGAPLRAFTSFDGRALRAHFAANRPGEFSVQVLADLAGGPRPVAEASVYADVEPPVRLDGQVAPGEAAGTGAPDDDAAMARMLAVARASAGLAALVRDPRLDAIARGHALRMAASHELAHDAGDGTPLTRLQSAGLDARETGENVARAPTVALAHRALWASPSHRANLLRAGFDRVGVGVARDDHGDAWVVEAFAGDLR